MENVEEINPTPVDAKKRKFSEKNGKNIPNYAVKNPYELVQITGKIVKDANFHFNFINLEAEVPFFGTQTFVFKIQKVEKNFLVLKCQRLVFKLVI